MRPLNAEPERIGGDLCWSFPSESGKKVWKACYHVVEQTYTCNCLGYRSHGHCKHIEYLKSIDISPYLNTGTTCNSSLVEFGLPALDEALEIELGSLLGITGVPMSGKTWLETQLSMKYLADHPDEEVIIIETEGFPMKGFKHLFKCLGNRFGSEKVPEVRVARGIRELFRLFGIDLSWKISEGGKFELTIQMSQPQLDFEKYSVIVVDSLSAPLKSVLGTATKNLPARADMENTLFGVLQESAESHSCLVALVNHISRPPQLVARESVFGGANIFYNLKYIIRISMPNKYLYDRVKDKGRVIHVDRHPYKLLRDESFYVTLERDYGFREFEG